MPFLCFESSFLNEGGAKETYSVNVNDSHHKIQCRVHNRATASAAGFMLSGWLVLPGQGSWVHPELRFIVLIFLMSQIRRINKVQETVYLLFGNILQCCS